MPQLNSNPWFFMVTTWLTFLLAIQPKLLSFITTNTPLKPITCTKITSWTWPWT